MTRFPANAALLAVLLLAAALVPATAQAGGRAGAGEESRTVTVRAECTGGGTIVLRHRTDADSTHVWLRGHGLGNGYWAGDHLLEVGVDDTFDTALELDADHGDLWGDFVVRDTGRAGVLDLRHGKRRCFASFDENRPFVIMGSATLSVLVRRTGTGLVGRTEIHHCRPGARWGLELGVDFPATGVGAGTQGACSREGWLRQRWELGMEPPPATRPVGMSFVARGQGSRERLTYHATRPPRG